MMIRFLVIALAIITTTVNAQNEVDALRYSTQNISGTARYSSMGGAFGSLGGEFSALSSNPAGIGMYQLGELTFTPSIHFNSNKSYFNNSHLSSFKSEIAVGNLGFVLAIPQKNSDWKRINLGIGWNQLSNYNNTIRIEGLNNESSIVDNIVEVTNGTIQEDLSNSYSLMAWNTFLIDPFINNNGDTINGEYVSNFSSESKLQKKSTQSNGAMNEFVISIGGAYKEKLYLGATIGIPTLNYYEYSEHNEREISDTANNLRQMSLSEEILASGTGYNLKIGAIYRLSETIKIGGAIHTPTLFNVKEDFNTSITTFFKDSTLNYSMGYRTPFNYNLITPLKASISASKIFQNILIAAEYEYIDFSTNEYFTAGFENENTLIKNTYQKTENIKLGAEININPFVLRAGYAKYGSAFVEKDFSRENFSYGIGINNGVYFFDLSYVLSQANSEYLLYSTDYIEPINLKNTNHNLLFTIGFRY